MPVRVEFTGQAFDDLVEYAKTGNLPLFIKKLLRLEDVGNAAGLPLGRGLTGWRKIVVGDRDWRIVPICTYVRRYLAQHPEFLDLVVE